jgi:hypothetical protein
MAPFLDEVREIRVGQVDPPLPAQVLRHADVVLGDLVAYAARA